MQATKAACENMDMRIGVEIIEKALRYKHYCAQSNDQTKREYLPRNDAHLTVWPPLDGALRTKALDVVLMPVSSGTLSR